MTNPPDSSTISDVTPTDPVPKHVVILEGCRLFTVVYFPVRSFAFFFRCDWHEKHEVKFCALGTVQRYWWEKSFCFFSGIRINTPEWCPYISLTHLLALEEHIILLSAHTWTSKANIFHLGQKTANCSTSLASKHVLGKISWGERVKEWVEEEFNDGSKHFVTWILLGENWFQSPLELKG